MSISDTKNNSNLTDKFWESFCEKGHSLIQYGGLALVGTKQAKKNIP